MPHYHLRSIIEPEGVPWLDRPYRRKDGARMGLSSHLKRRTNLVRIDEDARDRVVATIKLREGRQLLDAREILTVEPCERDGCFKGES